MVPRNDFGTIARIVFLFISFAKFHFCHLLLPLMNFFFHFHACFCLFKFCFVSIILPYWTIFFLTNFYCERKRNFTKLFANFSYERIQIFFSRFIGNLGGVQLFNFLPSSKSFISSCFLIYCSQFRIMLIF